jgi:hypothetical protein
LFSHLTRLIELVLTQVRFGKQPLRLGDPFLGAHFASNGGASRQMGNRRIRLVLQNFDVREIDQSKANNVILLYFFRDAQRLPAKFNRVRVISSLPIEFTQVTVEPRDTLNIAYFLFDVK